MAAADGGGGGGPLRAAGSLRLDVERMQREAQHRWLRPAEICEILRNFGTFQISSEAPNRPPSGSLFLFDRKVLRYFRKDGHNWRKKKDGKTVKEAHEKLKVGSIDVLHCYYAHGEENENFQRRSYWLLEKDFEHVVFVHYLEVKGKGGNRENETTKSNSHVSSSLSSSFSNQSETHLANTGSPSVTSVLTSSYEDYEYDDNHQAVSQFPSLPYFPSLVDGSSNTAMGANLMTSDLHLASSGENRGSQLAVPGFGYTVGNGEVPRANDAKEPRMLDMEWEQLLEQAMSDPDGGTSHPLSAMLAAGNGFMGRDNVNFTQLLDDQTPNSAGPELSPMQFDLQRNLHLERLNAQHQSGMFGEGSYIPKQPLIGSLQAAENLPKVDSFSKWASKELGDVGDLSLGSASNISWCNTTDTGNAVDGPSVSHEIQLDSYAMSPSISQDQLFSILDFSPSWTYPEVDTEVIVTGRFLKSPQEVAKCSWSCMFGEVEVPADVVKDGVLHCTAPPLLHVGRVPFYITCSNRLACSEVREFEYRQDPSSKVSDRSLGTASSLGDGRNEAILHTRLEKLLSSTSAANDYDLYSFHGRNQEKVSKIAFLLEKEEPTNVPEVASYNGSSSVQLLSKQMFLWLIDKLNEDGKGPNVLGKEGQGVLHLAAALGYDWIIKPALEAGAIINFRDVNGWTALHWAAFCGREKTVALLVSLGAASGALTDPSPEFPLGRTAADLASAHGHKGISGFLAESSLTTHLATLTMKDQNTDVATDNSLSKAVQTTTEKAATPDYECDPSLRDSLAALCNATQAADRIHQVFRMQSLQRKQISDHEIDDETGLPVDDLLALASATMQKRGQSDEHHSAAVQIQKNFRKYKKRKEFVNLRQTVVKIQAHVRGHQARKRYKPVVWCVGILEKVILRWKRKGTGLRGFRPDTQNKVPIAQGSPSEDDDYDFLKEGRKQSEVRYEKALVRVKSMVQDPEARNQYRRVLTALEDHRNKQEQVPRSGLSTEGARASFDEEDMIDVDALLGDTLLDDDDAFMSFAFDASPAVS
ncbi:Calmodulin-binding transcription activator 3-like protein [Drosera capensis]